MEEGEQQAIRDQVTAVWMNSDFIALGVSSGFKIFSLNPIKLIKYKDLGGGIGNIGLYSTDKIIWFVGGGEMPALPKNEFRLWDNQNDEQLLKIVMKSAIKQVWVKQDTIWIALIDTVWIYTLPHSEQIIKFDTVENTYGVLAVSQNEETNLAWFPGDKEHGELVIYDYSQDKIQWKIAGDSKNEFFITSIALSFLGNILAVTSSEGWTIHIYDTKTGTKLKDFTRGSTPAEFNFLSFQLDDTRLLVGSDTGTIHVFIVDSDIIK